MNVAVSGSRRRDDFDHLCYTAGRPLAADTTAGRRDTAAWTERVMSVHVADRPTVLGPRLHSHSSTSGSHVLETRERDVTASRRDVIT